MNVKESRAGFSNRLHYVRAGTRRVPDVDATPDSRIHVLYRLQYVQRRMPQPILWPVIMDRDANVIFLYELFDSRQSSGRGVASDNHANSGSLRILELAANIRIFVIRKIDGSGGVQPDARRGIVRERSRLSRCLRWEMILHVLGIQRQHLELLHELNHRCPAEVTERIAGQAQSQAREFVNWH